MSDGHLALMEAEGCGGEVLANAQEWVDVEFEVTLDSGSTDNVCHEGDAPRYVVEPSTCRPRADPPMTLCLLSKVPRSLDLSFLSFGKICDSDMDVLFNQLRARVLTRGADEIASPRGLGRVIQGLKVQMGCEIRGPGCG